MNKLIIIAGIFISIILSGCGSLPPSSTNSEYFKSVGGGFIYDRDNKEVKYALTVTSIGNVKPGNFMLVNFENPTGSSPLSISRIVKDGESEFSLQSPPVNGLKAHTNYKITILLFSSKDRSKQLGTHVQLLQSLVNQNDLGW